MGRHKTLKPPNAGSQTAHVIIELEADQFSLLLDQYNRAWKQWRDNGCKGDPPQPPPRELADNKVVYVERIEMVIPGAKSL